jgi:hypothetical protein
MSYLAPVQLKDGEAFRIATIPLFKCPPRDRILWGVGIYLQLENPIQVVACRRVGMAYNAAFVFSQKTLPLTKD